MCSQPQQAKDVEAGLLEIPEPHQAFICRVYLTISIQLLLTIVVAGIVVISIHPLAYFFLKTTTGLLIYFIVSLMMIIAFCLLYYYCFADYLLLGILTFGLAVLVGMTCAAASGKVILESVMLTTAVVVDLTLFSFWGARKGYDFEFLVPFLVGAIVFIMTFVSVQIIFPLGKIFVVIYACLGSITFCGHIVCVTDSLVMKNCTHEKHVAAAVCLYVEFINLFLLFSTVFQALDP